MEGKGNRMRRRKGEGTLPLTDGECRQHPPSYTTVAGEVSDAWGRTANYEGLKERVPPAIGCAQIHRYSDIGSNGNT